MELFLCVHTYLSVFIHNGHTISFSTKHNSDDACRTKSKLSGIFPRWKGVRGGGWGGGVIRELPKEIASQSGSQSA